MPKIILCLMVLSVMTVAKTAEPQELPSGANLTKENQNEKVLERFPRLKALAGLTYDAGEVEAPGSINHDFTFKNEGDAPLEINVKSGCACIVASYDPIILPGESGVISISMEFHPEWDGREVSRTTWVVTNDPDNRQIRLTMSARAKATP